MTPTPRLRFVERFKQIATDNEGHPYGPTIRVLQQWFAYDINYPTEKGEWKDVPLEKENEKL